MSLLFWRKKPAEPKDPIDAFWAWWADSNRAIARAIEDGTFDAWKDAFNERVAAIDERLAWEFGPGKASRHHVCVSAEGDLAVRVIAERWRSRAPADDAAWEYSTSRQADGPDSRLALALGGESLDYADFRVAIDVDDARRRVHVAIFHPTFPRLSEDQRGQAAYLFLDSLLGEDATEMWIGSVERSTEPIEGAVAPAALASTVQAVADREPSWSLLEGTRPDGTRMLAVVDFGVRPLQHLLFDVHHEVAIVYAEDGDLPDGVENEELNAAFDELVAQLGADAVELARETGGGRKTLHLRAAAGGPAADRIAAWERAYGGLDIRSEAHHDPQWQVLNRW